MNWQVLAQTISSKRHMPMIPESAKDKEYLAQNWLEQRICESGLPFISNGRNAHPDFIIGNEDFECKSLSSRPNGKACRRTFDFNSTPPVGIYNGRDQFVVHLFYNKTDYLLSSAVVCHGSVINDFVFPKINDGEPNVGTYSDGYIRMRRMYVFPHALDIDPMLIGKVSSIVPSRLAHPTMPETRRITRGDSEFLVYEIAS